MKSKTYGWVPKYYAVPQKKSYVYILFHAADREGIAMVSF